MGRPRLGIVLPEFGIPSQVWALRQAAAFERVEPVFFAWRGASVGQPPEDTEAHVFDLPFPPPTTSLRRLGWRLGLPAAVLPDRHSRTEIRTRLSAARLDGVLCHFAAMANAVVAALDGPEGPVPPVAVQVHGRDVSAFLANRAYRAAMVRTLPRLSFLAAVGRFQIDRLRPLAPLPPHAVIPCGAPFDRFAAAPPPKREATEPPRFVSVGRLSEEKGPLETLEAFSRLSRRYPDAELICIGDGPLAEPMRREAARFGRRVRLTGNLPTEAVASELSRAHVFVHHAKPAGGWIEGFGVSLTEAGATGLPLVASELGGIPDQVRDGENGFLFRPGDVAAQAAAMERLAEDEALRRRMGAAAREVARKFDSTLLARRLEGALLEAFAVQNQKTGCEPRASEGNG